MEMLQFPLPFPVPRRLVSEHFFHDYLQYNQCQAYRSAYFGVKISHLITGSIHASSIPVNLSDPHGRRSPAIQNETQEILRDDYFELKILVNEKNKNMIQTFRT